MQRTRRAVLSCMKNEGITVLEWAAYHRSIGFDPVIVVTNECTDGTDRMLARLSDRGEVVHLENPMTDGLSPQRSGLDHAMAHPAMAEVEWLLHIDADEFLHVSVGDGRIDDLITAVPDADAIAITWKPFGNAGIDRWPGGNVLERLTLTARKQRAWIASHKTLFRPDRFARADIHMPKVPHGEVTVRTTAGDRISPRPFTRPKKQRYVLDDAQVTWAVADIHHYAIRATDIYLMKNLRGDGMGEPIDKYQVGSTFWRRQNRNEVQDVAIQRHLPAIQARLAEWRADPLIAGMEHEAWTWFDMMRTNHLTPERISAWTREVSAR